MTHLQNGDALPPLIGKDPEGTEVDMTARVAGHYAAILFYRGDW